MPNTMPGSGKANTLSQDAKARLRSPLKSSRSTTLKRRRSLSSPKSKLSGSLKEFPIDLTGDDEDDSITYSHCKKIACSPTDGEQEKRARRFRTHPTASWLERKNRAMSQRWATRLRS